MNYESVLYYKNNQPIATTEATSTSSPPASPTKFQVRHVFYICFLFILICGYPSFLHNLILYLACNCYRL